MPISMIHVFLLHLALITFAAIRLRCRIGGRRSAVRFHRTRIAAATTARVHRTTRLGLLLIALRGSLGHGCRQREQQQPEEHDKDSLLTEFHFSSPVSRNRRTKMKLRKKTNLVMLLGLVLFAVAAAVG